eukprot:scaffold149758_cov13-Tisochrysis_lutea.AAC.1
MSRVLAPLKPAKYGYAGPLSGPIGATMQTQFVPGGAQGVGPESRHDPCQNEVLKKAPPDLPDHQRLLGTSSGACLGGSGGLGRGPENCPILAGKRSHLRERHRVH